MKKIVCLTDSLGSGGAQRQLVGLSILLKAKGYRAIVLTYHNIPFYKSELDKKGIDNHCIRPTRNIFKKFVRLRSEIKSSCGDIIIAYQEMPSLLACLIKLTIPKIKLIVSERNTTQHISIITRLRFFFYRFSDYVIPNSHSQGKFIAKHYPNLKNKIKVITNFVDTDRFMPISNRNKHKIPIICIVASQKKEKNFNRFVESIAILKNKGYKFTVDWWGINKAFIDRHRAIIKSKGLNDIMNVHTPNPNIEEIYNKSDFFCLPSLFEGFPNVLCEAMACGLPVIASAVCDNPYIVENGVNGYLADPYSPTDIAKQIEKLLTIDDDTYTKMSKCNHIKAQQLFSKNTFIENYIDIIKQL